VRPDPEVGHEVLVLALDLEVVHPLASRNRVHRLDRDGPERGLHTLADPEAPRGHPRVPIDAVEPVGTRRAERLGLADEAELPDVVADVGVRREDEAAWALFDRRRSTQREDRRPARVFELVIERT
jgi:hypothetical protein